MISWYVAQASSYARDVDNLILLIGVIVGVWFIAAEILFFWLIFRFRARDGARGQYLTGETKAEKRWVAYPHYAVLAFDVVILVVALQVWSTIKISAPPAEETVRIIGQQWAWTFVHAGPDGRLDTPDDIRTVDSLNVEVGRTYHFELHSRDVLHSFSVPAFRLKQDAVPGREIMGWFEPTMTGDFDVQCAEICGIGHGLMPATVHVRSASDHAAWMAASAGQNPPTAPVASVAARAVVADAAHDAAAAMGEMR